MSESRDRAEAKEQKVHIDSVSSESKSEPESESKEASATSGDVLYYDPWEDIYFKCEAESEESDSQVSDQEDDGFLW